MAHYCMQNEVLAVLHSQSWASEVWLPRACVTSAHPPHHFLHSLLLSSVYSALNPHRLLGFAQTIPLFFILVHPLCCPWHCQNSSPFSFSLCNHTSTRMPSISFKQLACSPSCIFMHHSVFSAVLVGAKSCFRY